jgi:hypothetical protein
MATGPTVPISQLSPQVLSRLQDPTATFWNLAVEVETAILEGMSELLLLLGRPLVEYSTLVTLTPNTVWQPMPKNVFAISNIRTNSYALWKTTLHNLDYLQASWSSSWESDRAAVPQRWAPLGLNYFIVHPAPTTAIQVLVAGLTYPVTDNWPPTGAETVPFHDEFFQALEMYAASYCRQRDMTDDAGEGNKLYAGFLQIAQRMSAIEDRRDPDIFSASLGLPTASSQTTRR